MKFIFSVCLLGCLTALSYAQLPKTNLFLADLTLQGNTVSVGAFKNITNREGYNNQPFFSPDAKFILYTSGRLMDTLLQTDIVKFDLQNNTEKVLSIDPKNEYSPQVTPDGKSYSVVYGPNQILQSFSLEDGRFTEFIIGDGALIGYYCWYNATTLLTFYFSDVLAPSLALWYKGMPSPERIITSPIGRSLHKMPHKDAVSYIEKLNNEEWFVNAITAPWTTNNIQRIKKLPKQSEDIAWASDGTLFTTHQSKIWKWKEGVDTDWVQIADLSNITNQLTRIAISPDGKKIVVVGN